MSPELFSKILIWASLIGLGYCMFLHELVCDFARAVRKRLAKQIDEAVKDEAVTIVRRYTEGGLVDQSYANLESRVAAQMADSMRMPSDTFTGAAERLGDAFTALGVSLRLSSSATDIFRTEFEQCQIDIGEGPHCFTTHDDPINIGIAIVTHLGTQHQIRMARAGLPPPHNVSGGDAEDEDDAEDRPPQTVQDVYRARMERARETITGRMASAQEAGRAFRDVGRALRAQGTTTGRMSSVGPNRSNTPKRVAPPPPPPEIDFSKKTRSIRIKREK